jgi:hypothetical protein
MLDIIVFNKKIFKLLNLSYKSIDCGHLYEELKILQYMTKSINVHAYFLFNINHMTYIQKMLYSKVNVK